MPRSLAVVVLAAGALVPAAVALAAPTSRTPPKITGTPHYGNTLACEPGTWSADAAGYDYAWQQPGGFRVATGRRWRATTIGYQVQCVVTARDAAGGTTSASSPPVTISSGDLRLRLTMGARQRQARALVVSGRVTPTSALRLDGRRSSITLYRHGRGVLYQLTFGRTLARDGRFRIRVRGERRGRHRYQLQIAPADSRYAVLQKSFRVRIVR